ncbi:hypothetical protein ACEPPN_015441 [Leptodophora sp. 'Broadleaf-Isolate-01']
MTDEMYRRTCGGYHGQTVFVQHGFGGKRVRRKGKTDPETAKCLQIPDNKQEAKYPKARTGPAIKFQLAQTKEMFSTEQEYLVSIIIENFTPAQEVLLVNSGSGTAACLNSRVCGAWVTLLPDIVALSSVHLNVLQFAIKSLGYSVLGKVSETLEAYGETLRSLNDVLGVAGEGSLEDLLAVMLCLSMTEVLQGTEHTGWAMHTQGISKLVQERGPETFKRGVLHQLFTSFRIFMVLGSIQQRKDSFLDDPSWKTIPFMSEPKSLMQNLLDEVAGLPALLQRLDTISIPRRESQDMEISSLLSDFVSQMNHLEDWEKNLKLTSGSNLLWWPVASSSERKTTFPTSYGFANILIANTMLHCWSFLIIVQISIGSLRIVTDRNDTGLPVEPRHRSGLSQDKTVELAKDICKSMQYHLQPEMKLYGPAATLFPINIAFQVFREAGMMKVAAWCEDSIVKLGQIGVRLAPYVPWIKSSESVQSEI